MSIGILDSARPLPSATATTATMTVNGLLMAKTIGFMGLEIPSGLVAGLGD
jgi:hypothetical protein